VAKTWKSGIATAGVDDKILVADVSRLERDALEQKVEAVRQYKSQVATIERAFGRRLDDPELLGYEVVWPLPAIGAVD